MAESMTRKQRVLAAVAGDPVDRPPYSFWGHAYHRESTARDLADATLEACRRHQYDFVKLNPRASYHGEVWGLEFRYSGVPDEKPKRVHLPVRETSDWAAIDERGLEAPALAEQIEAVRLTRRGLPEDVLLVETVFSPLSIAADVADGPDAVLADLRRDPKSVHEALRAITRTFEKFVPAVLAAGADGIFFATVDWATREVWSADDYARHARPYDLRLLAAAEGAAFNVVHVCRRDNLLRELADYPAHAFSWASTEPGNPGLAEALAWFPGAAMGGIGQDDALIEATPDAALRQLEAARRETGGRRWILAPGCSIPPATPAGHLEALRAALQGASGDVPASPEARR